jgi:hypothetical protein
MGCNARTIQPEWAVTPGKQTNKLFQQVNGQEFEIYSLFDFHFYVPLIFVNCTDPKVSFSAVCREFIFCKYCDYLSYNCIR